MKFTREEYVAAARLGEAAIEPEAGVLEIDQGALISTTEDGAYVQAWVWVGDDTIESIRDMKTYDGEVFQQEVQECRRNPPTYPPTFDPENWATDTPSSSS